MMKKKFKIFVIVTKQKWAQNRLQGGLNGQAVFNFEKLKP